MNNNFSVIINQLNNLEVSDQKSGTILFHGSPIIVKDIGMKAGTFFTDDLLVAKEYGEVIYRFETNEQTIKLFEKDCFGEHYISKRIIPFYMFTIIQG